MKTKILSVHTFRRTARKKERRLQAWLDSNYVGPFPREAGPLPPWARGVRVEKAGRFQWALVATGHQSADYDVA